MRSRSSLRAVAALGIFGVLTIGAGSALAQSEPTFRASLTSMNGVTFAPEANVLTGAERGLTASVVAPRSNATRAVAQQGGEEDQGIGFGVLGMITRTSYKADGLESFINDNTGYGFGLWVGGNRNGRVGFTGEFIYLTRGDDEFKSKALQIPAVFHVNFGSRSRNSVGGYVVVGPSFTINLQQELFGESISDNFNGADIGIIGGAGVEFFRIGLEGRGNWGLRSIDKSGDFGNIKTFTFEFLAKFAFN